MFRLKRAPIKTAAVLSVMAIVAAVAPSASSASYASSRPHTNTVSITFSHWDPNQLKYAFKPTIAAFEKANPAIKVNVQQVPYADYFTKLQTGLVSGTAPDVFVIIPNFIDEYEADHVLLNLTPYLKKAHVNIAKYAPFSVANCSVGKDVYGLPWTVDTIGMYYNKADLAKAGFTSYPTNLTWAPNGSGTLVPFLGQLTADANGKNATQAGCNSIPANDKNPQQAFEFAQYVSSAAGQTIMAATGALQPAVTSLGNIYVKAWKKLGRSEEHTSEL